MNLSPSITISSAVTPLAVEYAPLIVLGATCTLVVLLVKFPPLISVSNKFESLMITDPSLSTVRKINVSPASVETYPPILITLVEPSPINVGICALGFVLYVLSKVSSQLGSSILTA